MNVVLRGAGELRGHLFSELAKGQTREPGTITSYEVSTGPRQYIQGPGWN